MQRLLALLIVLAVALVARRSDAHGMRTATVQVVSVDAELVEVTIRAAVAVHGLSVTLDGCTSEEGEGGRFRCPGGFAGHRLEVHGLGPIASDAIVTVPDPSGEGTTTHLLQPSSPSWLLPAAHESGWAVARQYVGLGVRHIATGADHLLFLLGLVLCLRRARLVLLAETAFTLSHSLSFSAAALGWVHVSARWAEACIAFSLVLLALDVGRTRVRDGRRVASLAFVFGLVHGLGFAGGLSEIGIPEKAVLPALVGFAGGVELGQVAFLVGALLLFGLAARLRRDRFVTRAGALAIGAAASFWLVERVVALLSPGGSV